MVEEFKDLTYSPSYENEVILLFDMLMPHLERQFVINEYNGLFPDCYRRQREDSSSIERWQDFAVFF